VKGHVDSPKVGKTTSVTTDYSVTAGTFIAFVVDLVSSSLKKTVTLGERTNELTLSR